MSKRFLLLAFLSVFAIKAIDKNEIEIIKPTLVDIKNNTKEDFEFLGILLKSQTKNFSIKIPAGKTTLINKELVFIKGGLMAKFALNLPGYFLQQINGEANYTFGWHGNELQLSGEAKQDWVQSVISNKLTTASGDHFTIELKQPDPPYHSAELKLVKTLKRLDDISVNNIANQIQEGKFTLESLAGKIPKELIEKIHKALE